MPAGLLKTILCVEDDPDIRTIATLALEAGGFQVEACSSGVEALSLVLKRRPDLIILDVMMPGLDGMATLVELRKMSETATVPVVFMTAKVQPAEISHYRQLGALGVVIKPFDPMRLPQEIREIWERGHV